MKKTKKIIFILICVVVGGMLGAFMAKNSDNQNDDTNANNDVNTKEEIVECIEIKTPFVILEFPEEMKDEVTIKTEGENEDSYKIQFYGTIGDDEELLMDIAFGIDEGVVVGRYKVNDKEIPVSVTYYEPENIDSLDDDEVIHMQEIHMASEYVISNLSKSDKFVPAE